jgi:4a-hydroxytetrahydrobiopterin dehydratase
MSAATAELVKKHCVSCEGHTAPLTSDQVQSLITAIPNWKLSADKKSILREWRVKKFDTAVDFFNRIARIAEAEDHHPDLHLTGYRNVAIVLWTHAVNGLTENDFIMAAKIDQLDVELKT